MPPLPVVSAAEAIRVFEAFGWRVARRGNHVILVMEGSTATLSIPNHPEIARGTLRSLIRSAGLTVDQFVAALRQ
jgi:predicted RNA binding protein YcfA (HicA-like mRNA interferase family)